VTTPAEAVGRPGEPPAPSGPRAPLPLPLELLRLSRPRQWIKNVLVFVAPAAAGVLFHRTVLLHAIAAFGLFCVAASGTYFLNDAIDAESDRRHPKKRQRPIAAGMVSIPMAVGLGVALLAISTGLAALLAGWHLSVVIAIYAAINVAYSLELKNEPVVDLVAVSAGFVLRAVAGGVATGVALSNWFLIVTSFGSLLVVTGKRSGEMQLLDEHDTDHDSVRQTLGSYTPTFLRSVRTMSAAVTVTAYCLWAFERAAQLHPGHDPIWFQLTVVPFTIALLHVVLILDSGVGAAPEELALEDHRLQVYGVCWVALFAIGIYAT
jgi:decaprenyl-phosphate phosphoribosyltransferase